MPPSNNRPLMPSPFRVTHRRRVLDAAESFLHWSGMSAAYAHTRRLNGAQILMYHSVPGQESARWIDPKYTMLPEMFRAQMRFLARRRCVVSMRELVEACNAGRNLPRGSVVITFDDGYRDHGLTAAPILDDYGLPATFFLPTAYVDSGEPQWIDRLYTALKFRSQGELDLVDWGLSRWDLNCQAGLDRAHSEITDNLLVVGWQKRLDLLGELERQLRPVEASSRTTLNWDEVRQLAANPRFEIGGHTRNHIDLSTCSNGESSAEVRGCMEDIRRQIGRDVIHFSYPYGRCASPARDLLADAGVESAVIATPGRPVRKGEDLLGLPRFDAGVSPTRFRFMTGGAYPDLPLALFGHA